MYSAMWNSVSLRGVNEGQFFRMPITSTPSMKISSYGMPQGKAEGLTFKNTSMMGVSHNKTLSSYTSNDSLTKE